MSKQLIITIGTTNPPTYSSNPPTVEVGGSVLFILQGRTDTVELDFTLEGVECSPFDVNDFTLDGSSALTAQKAKTVESSARIGSYRFKVLPPGTPRPKGEDPDPPGTVSGDVDVIPQTGGPKDPAPSGG
ncbi:MAG TPA: hypothetical protein VF664_06575 [Cystobacter sp.]|jgi:hypothetical protein